MVHTLQVFAVCGAALGCVFSLMARYQTGASHATRRFSTASMLISSSILLGAGTTLFFPAAERLRLGATLLSLVPLSFAVVLLRKPR